MLRLVRDGRHAAFPKPFLAGSRSECVRGYGYRTGLLARLLTGRGAGAPESPDHGAGEELRDLQFLPRLSPGKLRELAYFLSPHHDAGGDVRDVDSRRAQRRAELCR